MATLAEAKPAIRIDPAAVDDSAAIGRLRESLALQKAAVRRAPCPPMAERIAHLQALIGMMAANRQKIRAALLADFASHPAQFTDVIEVASVMGRAQMSIDNLPRWMAPEPRETDALFGDCRAYMQPQPKGVVGNMVPWNLPFELGCGPLTEMLAAGNRVILKPSEFTPACADLLEEMIAATFDRDHVTVAVGGVDLARAFTQQPWDHLLYTGSTPVGRKVMAAAAENLVPVTLELGGKCPTVVTRSGMSERTLQSILGMKLVKNGQVCVSVDHVLVPGGQMDEFVALAQAQYRGGLAGHSRSDDCTGIITERHLDRIVGLIDEARASGARVLPLDDGGVDRTRRSVPLTLVVDPSPGLSVMTDEIFGPVMPVIPYDDIDQAIDWINGLERPLCINVYGEDEGEIDKVVGNTFSGGVTVNGAALSGACTSLGFGGIGQSGMGRHHGVEGFREFSNNRAVFVRGREDGTAGIFPPFGAQTDAMVKAVFGES
ncbi:MAG: aldehyde dehydrogenase family protein [Sphingobium sp.]